MAPNARQTDDSTTAGVTAASKSTTLSAKLTKSDSKHSRAALKTSEASAAPAKDKELRGAQQGAALPKAAASKEPDAASNSREELPPRPALPEEPPLPDDAWPEDPPCPEDETPSPPSEPLPGPPPRPAGHAPPSKPRDKGNGHAAGHPPVADPERKSKAPSQKEVKGACNKRKRSDEGAHNGAAQKPPSDKRNQPEGMQEGSEQQQLPAGAESAEGHAAAESAVGQRIPDDSQPIDGRLVVTSAEVESASSAGQHSAAPPPPPPPPPAFEVTPPLTRKLLPRNCSDCHGVASSTCKMNTRDVCIIWLV